MSIFNNDKDEKVKHQQEFNPNPINEFSPVTFSSRDEFFNDRSESLIKYIHHVIKSQLKDPDKEFILLINSDTNKDKFKPIFSTDPNRKKKLFQEIEDNPDLKDVIPASETTQKSDNEISLANIFSVVANDYYTDPETGIQHFPDSILKYDNTNYWYSEVDGTKQLKIIFNRIETIHHLVIDFYDVENIKYEFKIIYNIGERDQKGNPQYDYVRDSKGEPILYKNENNTELQVINFKNYVLTNELVLEFETKKAGINYMFPLNKQVSEQVLNSFLQI